MPRSHAKPPPMLAVPTGDALINCTPVHEALGDSISEALPISVAVSWRLLLLSSSKSHANLLTTRLPLLVLLVG